MARKTHTPGRNSRDKALGKQKQSARRLRIFTVLTIAILIVGSIAGFFLFHDRDENKTKPSRQSSTTYGSLGTVNKALPSSTSPEMLYEAEGGASAQNPALSPDGQTVLFTVFKDGYNKGSADLRTISIQHPHDAHILLSDAGFAAVNLPGTSWSPVTNRIAFASDRQDHDEIWTSSPAGTDLTRVTHHTSDSAYIEPSFSPDGSRLTFEEDTGSSESTQTGSIRVVNANGSGLIRIVDGPGTNTDNRQPNWSPKNNQILFQRKARDADHWTLYTIAPDGSNMKAVTDGSSDDTDASWSPDGRSIVYSSNHGGLPSANLFIVSVDGGEPQRATVDTGRYDGAVSWSPDGNWLYYESKGDGSEGTPTAIWRVQVPKK